MEMVERSAKTGMGKTASAAGKYLTFALGAEQYGLEILQVREIVAMMDITAVPRAPRYVKGVINLRGKVVPVMDLRSRLEMPPAELPPTACMVVVNVNGAETALLVDKVLEVMDIPADDVADTPDMGGNGANYLLGMGKVAGRVVLLLDLAAVVSQSESVAPAGAVA